MNQKRFCVMTVGRTGSTWLINALGALPGVTVPSANVASQDNELIHHKTQPKYEQLAGRRFASAADYIEFFFQLNQDAKFVGFKSMPRRHADYDAFIQRPDVQFITLDRHDIVATAASFLNATKHRAWRRFGGTPEQKLRFEASDRNQVMLNVPYMLRSRLELLRVPKAIRLYYEDLCQPGYVSPELESYFEQKVVLPEAKPPTQTADYVENYEEFRALVESCWQQAADGLGLEFKTLLDSERLVLDANRRPKY